MKNFFTHTPFYHFVWLLVFLQLSFTPLVRADEMATLEFEGLQDTYYVGDVVEVDLVEIVPPERTQPIDLWFAVQLPSGDIIFITQTPLSVQQPFKAAVETTETSHKLLEFEVPPDFGGDYTLYALYVEPGKNPLADGIDKVGRSNLLSQIITLSNEMGDGPPDDEPPDDEPPDDEPPADSPDGPNPFTFTPLSYAVANTDYTSNTITINDFEGSVNAVVSGGNATLIKNGTDTGSHITEVTNGDTLVIKTRASASAEGVVNLTLTVGDKSIPWSVTTAAIPSLPGIPGQMSGYTAGEFQVNESGAATYAIPITVSPGTAGIKPNLSIAYSSQGRNGLLGMGWSLGGLSTISRCPATLAQDNGLIDPVDFDDNDRFCLDGERLMAVQGTYGADDTVYYTEQNTFKKVVSHDQAGNGPEKFTVWTKAGLIMEYGHTVDSRIEAQGKDSVLFWALNKIQDTKGNYLTVFYQEDNANGEYLPKRIDYTGNAGLAPYNSVQFFYENRADVVPKYIGGSLLKTTKRLSRIETWEGADIFRKYRFAYQEGAVTKRSQLVSVTECGTDGSCFAPTAFEWSQKKTGFVDEDAWITGAYGTWNTSASRIRPMDVNGDGLSDFVIGPNNKGQWFVLKNTGSSFVDEGAWITGAYGTWNTSANRIRPMDVNGDGLPDIVIGPNSKGQWFVLKNTGSSFVDDGLWITSAYGGWHDKAGRIRPMDVNGDGLPDIVIGPNNKGQWFVLKNTDSSFENEGAWINDAYGNWDGAASRIRPMDVNGDGLPDIVLGPGSKGNWFVLKNTGSSFENEEAWITGAYGGWHDKAGRIRPMDVNGDGLPDIVIGPNSKGEWFVLKNTGSRFENEGAWIKGAYGSWDGAASRIRPMDVNGDGLPDIVLGPGSKGNWFVLKNTGSSFVDDGLWIPGVYGGWHDKADRIRPMDVNGDGLLDIVIGPDNKGQWFVLKTGQSGTSPNLLSTVTNGHNATTKIDYKPLTDNSVYTKENNADYPQVDVQMPLYVVSSYKVTNGIGGENQISYHYTGAKMDLHGRGFRGFSKTTVTDKATGIRNTLFYQRDYRYLSTKVKRTEQRLADGTLIAETDNTSELKDYGNGVHFSRIKQSTENKYEAAGPKKGQLITTTVTSNLFDDFGNPTQIVVDQGNGYTETTVNTYTNDTVNWILGRLTNAAVTKTVPGQSAQTRTSAFEYDSASGLLIKEIIEPNQATLRLEKTYQHNAYGNIVKSTVSGQGIETRTHTTVYDQKGRYVTQSENALGHKEYKAYDKGNLITLIGPNALTTQWQYDGFGRPLVETRADGTQTKTVYRLCNAKCPPHAKYFVRTDTSGAAPTLTYYDVLDRAIRQHTVGFDGRAIYVDTQYNVRGEVSKVSDPYFGGDTPLWTVSEYDAISRPVKQTTPGNRVTTTSYQGLTTVATNPLGQKNTRTVNVLGQLVTSVDNLNNEITYVFDGFGNLIELRDPAGNVTQIGYDLRGNKIWMYDADTGQTAYVYNALGELVSQTDAKAQTVKMSYDPLGRLIQRQEPEGVSTWLYDTQPKGIGKLATVTGPNGYQETYRYDSFGRPVESPTTLNGQTYFVSKTYDQFGRADSVTYPTGFAVKNVYNSNGYLTEVRRASDNERLWQAKRLNARGQIEQLELGNGLVTDKIYDALTGRLQQIQTGGGVTQNLGFGFDKLGNLTQRTSRHLVETFQYDGLNRLTQTAVQGVYSTTLTYDALGNITSKSDVGSYTYGENGAGPHAVSSITGLKSSQYTYDANGNRISSSATGQQIEYTSFNKPRRITQGDTTLEFAYGPSYSRYAQTVTNSGLVTTTNYIGGGIFEREVSQDWVKYTHYIFAGGESVAVHIEKNHGIEQETRYLHKDHLGSIDAITDENGQLVESFSFDAWGQRRNPDTWGVLTDEQLREFIDKDLTTDRGFTGHEHLDEVQLIHMNGRVYDPVIGRFLSADPLVQAPSFSQSLNRYSYVLNNPLSLVDPSGFLPDFLEDVIKTIGKAVKAVGKFVKKYLAPVVIAVAGAALGAVTGGLGTALFGALAGGAFASSAVAGATTAVLSGAGFGFGSAFAGTLVGGGRFGDALKAGLRGAVIGGITAGIGSTSGAIAGAKFLGTAAPHVAKTVKIIANGVVSGLSSVDKGGKFEHGFIKSVIPGALNYLYQGALKYKPKLFGPAKAMAKTCCTLPQEDVNNWGPQGPKYANHIFREGGPISRFMSTKVPLMNAIAGMHDYMQVQTRKRFPALTKFTNIPYMIPATLITVGAYLGEKQ